MAEPTVPVAGEEGEIIQLKPGVYTSAFWITTITSVLALLGTLGVIGSEVQSELASMVEDVVLGVFSLGAVIHYAYNRRKLKTAVAEQNAKVIVAAIKEENLA